MFCRSLFVILSFSFWPLYFLSIFDSPLLITTRSLSHHIHILINHFFDKNFLMSLKNSDILRSESVLLFWEHYRTDLELYSLLEKVGWHTLSRSISFCEKLICLHSHIYLVVRHIQGPSIPLLILYLDLFSVVEKTEGAIKNGQSLETGNIGYITQDTGWRQTKQKHNTEN